jgi:hypothetical protein
MEPREYAARAESVTLPNGEEERFAGWGIMGLPFRSGHVLGLRRFPASSVGRGYTSVWHRGPDGRWTFYADAPPLQSCNRYFGAEVDEFTQTEVVVAWQDARTLTVSVPEARLDLRATISSTPITTALSGVSSLMPEAMWQSPLVLDAMAPVAGALLRAGRVRLRGTAPNGQAFIANPMRMWVIDRAEGSLRGDSFGPVGPLREQISLGDFAIPQRGIFVIGRAVFTPFDPECHLSAATRSAEVP